MAAFISRLGGLGDGRGEEKGSLSRGGLFESGTEVLSSLVVQMTVYFHCWFYPVFLAAIVAVKEKEVSRAILSGLGPG